MTSLLVIFNGESNSGGYASNAELSGTDLQPFPKTQILNNSSLLFESLQVGVNNLIDHAGLVNNATHGWEVGLARRCVQGKLGPTPVYLLKTGQGGSIISQWNSGGAYYTTFLARVNAAKTLLASTSYTPVVWYTQGINDAIAGSDIPTWKAATLAHFTKIRLELPTAPILFGCNTIDSTNFGLWHSAMREVVGATSNCYYINTVLDNNNYRDPNHWNAAGMLINGYRLADKTAEILNLVPKSKVLPDLFKPSFLTPVLD